MPGLNFFATSTDPSWYVFCRVHLSEFLVFVCFVHLARVPAKNVRVCIDQSVILMLLFHLSDLTHMSALNRCSSNASLKVKPTFVFQFLKIPEIKTSQRGIHEKDVKFHYIFCIYIFFKFILLPSLFRTYNMEQFNCFICLFTHWNVMLNKYVF